MARPAETRVGEARHLEQCIVVNKERSQTGLPKWRSIGIWLIILAIFDALLVFFPRYSPYSLMLASFLSIAGLVVITQAIKRRQWWHEVVISNVLFLYFLGLSARALLVVLPNLFIVGLILIVPYCLAWLLPEFAPRISSRLFREQFSPETRLGQGCLSGSLALLPLAGVAGAFVQMYGASYVHENLIFFFVGVLGAMIAVGWAQTTAHQLWPKRPWAQEKPEQKAIK